ncbi:phenylalanine--tRNA ligase subunit beta, partial [Streptococcus agalactiae]|nr:phenylalanine--tRNA ligase subunit beta [Streptococcus agalactiae]MCK6356418.1 phenylalanine--tRNA ligase subunit beta [Streptococcus agalactiae]
IVEALFIKLKLDVTFVAQKGLASMHPGRTATILLDGKEIGFVGQVHPQTAKQYDIPETYVAEINLSTIESQMNQALIFEDITKYPSVSRDIALLLAESVSHHDIVSAIETSGVKRLTAIKLFDVYAGNNIAEGYKSMAYSLTFQNPNDNLTDEEVAKYMEKITKSLVEKVNAEIR